MVRRSAIALLWFVAFAFAGEVLWSMGVSPRALGVIVAAAVAGLVWLDPIRQLHPQPAPRTDLLAAPRATEAQLLPR